VIRFVVLVIGVVIALAAVESAGPAIVSILNSSWPIVLIVGVVVIAARLTWYFTNRW
jgi:hypothetical protein